MKKEAHLVIAPLPISWVHPKDIEVLCGFDMTNAMCVLDFQIHDLQVSTSTLRFCDGCTTKYLTKRSTGEMSERTWNYAVMEDRFASRLNAGQGEDE
ncbi:MAG: hypothetical protein JWQ87_5410 [Candidatus Sulfotelmatobacter sp.]|nr:hypothetical protein [Candidatus Sulfotelmatobacter sp.]